MTAHRPGFQIDTTQAIPATAEWTKTSAGETDLRVMISGLRYDYRFDRRCLTCTIGDPWITEINQAAVMGIFATAIYRDLPEEARKKISLDSLRTHIRKHLGDTARHHQAMISVFRSCIGISSDQHPDVLSAEMAARSIMMTGVTGIMNGSIDVKTSDVLGAAKMVQEIEDRTAQKDQAALFGEAATIIMQSARDAMTEEAYNAMVWKLQSNERIREIMAVLRGDEIPRQDFEGDENLIEIEESGVALEVTPV